jgi:hypothetical protein
MPVARDLSGMKSGLPQRLVCRGPTALQAARVRKGPLLQTRI